MNYIKTQNEYEMLNEGKLTWKQLLIGLGIVYTLNNLTTTNPLTNMEISELINDVNNNPTPFEDNFIRDMKGKLIYDIISTAKISELKKSKIVEEINKIKFICVDSETINSISADGNVVLGCYITYLDSDKKLIKAIFIDKNKINKGLDKTIIHELRHLVDDALGSRDYRYSEMVNVVDMLDKDIVIQNEIGKKKLRDKIKAYTVLVSERILGFKINSIKDTKKLNKTNSFIEETTEGFLKDLSDENSIRYLTSPEEVYARFHGMKKWMIQNGYIEDMNSEITQEHIIRLFNDHRFYDGEYLDFKELIFFLNVDLSGKTKSNMDKGNSIVANYTDYINRNV
jgi:hypothetical protein